MNNTSDAPTAPVLLGEASAPVKGFKIPAPADFPRYHEWAAGAVGDYRPLAERQLEAFGEVRNREDYL